VNRDLAELVKRMRDAQRRYFRLHNDPRADLTELDVALVNAKQLERQVDKEVADVLSGQGHLFDRPDTSSSSAYDKEGGQ